MSRRTIIKAESSSNNISNSHHLKNLKQQYNDRKLIYLIINLIKINDHDTLAFIARTYGIPPQLRHVVWPILLKYHPMCISPNIISNLVNWDPQTKTYQYIQPLNKREGTKKKNNNNNGTSITTSNSNNKNTTSPNNTKDEDLEYLILHDLKKYFHIRTNKPTNATTTPPPPPPNNESSTTFSPLPTTTNSNNSNNANNNIPVTNEFIENDILNLLKNAIVSFLTKWSSIFKYENGLAWVALGLAEWFPIIGSIDEPMVLTGRRHSKDQKDNNYNSYIATDHLNLPKNGMNHHIIDSINNLYNEYPLPQRLKSRLPENYQFQFNELYERLLLVILHCPDTVMAQDQINKEFPVQSSNMSNYFPILSGGDLTFQSQIFFKIFASILPELYQPLMEETDFPQTSSSKSTWLYWWIKFSGAKVLQRQDRGRLWDILLGWRPKPNMNSINFYLNYNTKIFHHLYKKHPPGYHKLNDLPLGYNNNNNNTKINGVSSYNNDNRRHHGLSTKIDPFWFPDLNSISFGSPGYPYDYNIFKELLIRNKYEISSTPSSSVASSSRKGNQTNMTIRESLPSPISSSNSSTVSLTDTSISSSEDDLDVGEEEEEEEDNDDEDENTLIYSLIDPHIEILFIYMAILQYNEFKLLEFEETEISEFLNNLPMCSRIDDSNYQRLYLMEELNNNSNNNASSSKPMKKSVKSYSISASSLLSSTSATAMAMTTAITTPSSSLSSSTSVQDDLETSSRYQSNNNNMRHAPINKNLTSANTSMSTINKSHMFIEVGNDAKASHSFNDLLAIAGDIWRKWLWKELEENLDSE